MASRVVGRRQVEAFSARLKASPKILDAEVPKALKRAVPKIMRKVEMSIARRFPHRGGYAPVVVKSLRHQSRTIQSGMSLSIWAVGKKDRRALSTSNKGLVRHPVFGNREVWRVTHIRPGAVSDPLRHEAPRIVGAELRKPVNDMARFIAKG